jgi:hypothetical protein
MDIGQMDLIVEILNDQANFDQLDLDYFLKSLY